MLRDNYLNKLKLEFDRIKPVEGYETDDRYGVIYVGGGKYWPGIVVGIKMLREFSNLPVEVWHRKCETVYPEDIKNCENVTLNLINENCGGWEAKLYALMHTRLGKVLYLDADAYVVQNPWTLFNYIREKPFAFWKDLHSQISSVKWPEVWPNGDNGVIAVQGGQLLIDRIKGWKLVHLSRYMCQNSDYYFHYMYGDQDTWRVALAMGACDYQIIGNAEWLGVAFQCKANNLSEQTSTYVVHRCQGKLFDQFDIPPGKVRYTNYQPYLPLEQKVFDYLTEVLQKRQQESPKVFNNIYNKKLWGEGSGTGSKLKEGRLFIDQLNLLIRSKGWKTLIDVGCGDGILAQYYECGSYTGYDCSEYVIRANKVRWKKGSYIALDIFKESDIINNGDVLVCKDVLHHWPNEMITKWLSSLIESKKWKAIVLCQDSNQLSDRQDTFLGGYRALKYSMYPLNLFPFKFVSHVHHKDLLLWERME